MFGLSAHGSSFDVPRVQVRDRVREEVGKLNNTNRHQRIELGFKATDDEIIELVNNGSLCHFCIYDRKRGDFKIEPEINMGEIQLVPPFMTDPIRGGELVRKGSIILPSAPAEYDDEATLLSEVQGFIHAYCDVGEFYEQFSTYYAMFSYMFDKFNTLPYLRILGDFGAGKTRFLDVMSAICYRSMKVPGATTSSPIFRTIDAYHGTLFLDEANFKDSDMFNDLMKILNFGFQKGWQVLRSEEVGGRFEPKAYDCYGPKIISARVPFKDDATESRCFTHYARISARDDIPLILGPQFWEEAERIRNKLLMWRLRNWGKDFKMDFELFKNISEARIKQIAIPLMAIIDDKDAKRQIEEWVYEYWQQLIAARTETLEYSVLIALNRMWENEKIRPKEIANMLNEGVEKGEKKITPEKVGRLLRGMGFKSWHDKEGSFMEKDQGLLNSLNVKYGVTVLKDICHPTVTSVTKKPVFRGFGDGMTDVTVHMGAKDDRCDSNKNGSITTITLSPPSPPEKPSHLSPENIFSGFVEAFGFRPFTAAQLPDHFAGETLKLAYLMLPELEKRGNAMRQVGEDGVAVWQLVRKE